LFALKRYDEAASVAYAVLSAGPCWNWATLAGLYADVETYTNQLRGLEAAVKANPSSVPTRFLLAYHYLVQDNEVAAGAQFADVAKLEPKDQLSASFAKALTKASESTTTANTPAFAGASTPAPAAVNPGGPPATATTATTAANSAPSANAPAEAPPPPPAELSGTWKANASPDTAVSLALQTDGAFTWSVSNKGQQQESLSGRAAYVNDILSLAQENGPPLSGKIESKEANKFVFHIMGGGANAPSLTFTR
jgi:hypothetical protein